MTNHTPTPIREQLKTGLTQAMKARQSHIVRVLRATLGQIDNAEAVETDTHFVPLTGVSHDVPRKILSEAEMRQIVQTEADELKKAAMEYAHLGKLTESAELQAEWEALNRYLQEA